MLVSQLKKAVALLKRAAADGKTRPILGGIRIDKDGMESTDLDVSFSATMETGIATPIVVDAKRLSQVIRSLKAKDEVHFEISDEGLKVQHFGGTVILPLLVDAEDFPETAHEVEAPVNTLTFVSKSLQRRLMRVAVASAKDSTRYQLHSVLFVLKDRTLNLIATDGKRLVRETMTVTGEDFEAIVPLPAVELLLRMPDIASLQIYGDSIRATSSNGYAMDARTVEGVYPDWKRAIPEEGGTLFTMMVADLQAATETALLGTTKETNSVAFRFTNGIATVTGESAANGKANGMFPVTSTTGNGTTTVSFNPKYVVEMCKSLKDHPFVSLKIKDHKSAGLFFVDDFSCVIMPLVTYD